MSRFARGKYAYIIDDRTGFKIRYKDARTEWTGARVHYSEWEPKHPALTPLRSTRRGDPTALRNPRPNTDDDGGVTDQLEDVVRLTGGGSFNFGAT